MDASVAGAGGVLAAGPVLVAGLPGCVMEEVPAGCELHHPADPAWVVIERRALRPGRDELEGRRAREDVKRARWRAQLRPPGGHGRCLNLTPVLVEHRFLKREVDGDHLAGTDIVSALVCTELLVDRGLQ